MIPAGVEIFVAVAPIDLRWSFDRLAGLVREQVGREARCGALFVFFGRRRTALKILFFDGSGMCQLYKRLDARIFKVPELAAPGETSVELAPHALDALLDGVAVEAAPRRSRGASTRSERGRIH